MAKRKSSKKTKSADLSSVKVKSNKWSSRMGWAVAVFGVLLYLNTLGHQYALDDFSVIKDNYIVKQGWSGLSTILTTNYRYGYWNTTGTLYRPVSLIIFATIWQIAGDSPLIFHLVNVLFYGLTGWLIFKCIRRLWPALHWLFPTLVCLLFMAHPLHVEVVANIKSLDEILGFGGAMLAVYWLLKYLPKKNIKYLILAVLAYTLALFSKENAVTFLAVFPLVVLYKDRKQWRKSIWMSLVFIVPVILYLGIRYTVLQTQTIAAISPLDNLIMAAPDTMTQLATSLQLLLKYFLALLFPYPMGSDFGYNQIPIVGFGSLTVILSLVIYLILLGYGIYGLRYRNRLAFGILFFLITFSIFTNIIIHIGSSYGERFLYTPSLGYAIALVVGIGRLLGTNWSIKTNSGWSDTWKQHRVLIGILVVIIGLYSIRTVTRNSAWYDSYTLYATDIKVAPNSAKLNYHLGLEEVKKALDEKDPNRKLRWQNQAFQHFEKAIQIYPTYSDAYGQLGLAYFRQNQADQALAQYRKALEYDPNDAKVYSNMGIIFFQKGDLKSAEEVYIKAVEIDPRYVDARRNLGSVYAQTRRFNQAIEQFKEGIKYDPTNATLHLYLGFAYRDQGNAALSSESLQRAYQLDPSLRK